LYRLSILTSWYSQKEFYENQGFLGFWPETKKALEQKSNRSQTVFIDKYASRCALVHAIPLASQNALIQAADALTPANKNQVFTLQSSHSSFFSMPAQLASVLMQAAPCPHEKDDQPKSCRGALIRDAAFSRKVRSHRAPASGKALASSNYVVARGGLESPIASRSGSLPKLAVLSLP